MSVPQKLYTIKRDGRSEEVVLSKIQKRIEKLCVGLNMNYIDTAEISRKVVQGLYPGVRTVELDNLAAEISASMSVIHTDYGQLAARISISNLHKETPKRFSEAVELMYRNVNPLTRVPEPMISKRHYKIVCENRNVLDQAIENYDTLFDYFAIKTLEKSYLLRVNGKIVETPQYMYMRVALGIHDDDMEAVKQTYHLMSIQCFIHATPTLFAAATPLPQLSSCYLLTIHADSITGIFKTISDCASISKYAGGVGLNVHKIRARGSRIAGTHGTANGLVPMLKVLNEVARYVDQGGGKRMGSIAVYLEPWHADVFDFVELKKNQGQEENRARNLFYALWIPDLFMERVEADLNWSLMCPHQCPGLDDVWGEEFVRLYEQYESIEGKVRRTIKARELWRVIMESQTETGTPYIMYKDACNRKSNQQHLGTIKCGNLCTEIVEFTSPNEIAVCNLASISLPAFIVTSSDETGVPVCHFDFQYLREVVGVITENLNKIIDNGFYPVEEAAASNRRHRPIGIGIQGFANVLARLRYPYESAEAALLNQQIFETIYYGALQQSCILAKKHGRTYETFAGSPASQGILQYDMWTDMVDGVKRPPMQPTQLWDWDELKANIGKYGLYNSLLVAPMPTATTAQILGNNESFEPFTNNIYVRRVLSGEFNVINKYLIEELVELGLWTDYMRNKIMEARGSIQNIEEIPQNVRDLYKTVWEIPTKTMIDMAATRGAFIDQSQSFSVYMAEPTYASLTSMHFYGWKRGLKTGMYYLRTKSAINAIQFTVDKCLLQEQECTSCSAWIHY